MITSDPYIVAFTGAASLDLRTILLDKPRTPESLLNLLSLETQKKNTSQDSLVIYVCVHVSRNHFHVNLCLCGCFNQNIYPFQIGSLHMCYTSVHQLFVSPFKYIWSEWSEIER